MADATVAITAGRVASFINLAAVPVTVAYSATTYTTASGGLPFDLFSTLAAVSPQALGTSDINTSDIVALVPFGTTAEKFVVDGNSFAVGTVTSTTVPCTVRIYGTGSGNKAALTEVDNAALTGSFKALLIIARNGA